MNVQTPYRVTQCQAITSKIYRVILMPLTNHIVHYDAGQYIEVRYKKDYQSSAGIADQSLLFSIANAPLPDGKIELHIRITEPAAEALLNTLQIDQVANIAGPFGHCAYRDQTALPDILLAGGTGFAPCKAIIELGLTAGFVKPLHLYWGVRKQADLYFHQQLNHWAKTIKNFYYIPVLSEEEWHGRMGLVHEAIVADFSDLSEQHIYAAGPPEMILVARRVFLERGLNKHLFHSDLKDLKDMG